ncbi:hypothetical protein [Streptomyces sp. NPDC005507]|uniref:hypothetical protein n=1 Tax=Streptomyces sp. NPDC005507 TaxID=3154885 RepID=UPI0033ACC87E
MLQVVAAWHGHDSEDAAGPLEIWLIDDLGDYIHITTGSDWCLIVDDAAPHAGYDLGESGRVEVVSSERRTAFARYVGEAILAVDQRFDVRTGRVGLEICFSALAACNVGVGAGTCIWPAVCGGMILGVAGVITASEPS